VIDAVDALGHDAIRDISEFCQFSIERQKLIPDGILLDRIYPFRYHL